MAACKEIPFPSVTGASCKRLVWQPEAAPRGIVQIVHGMAEHIRRYDGLARALNDAGFIAVGHDLLGHGEQAPVKGCFAPKDGWDALIADIHTVRGETQKEYPSLPYFLLGHSMGSFLTRCYLFEYSHGLKGAVLSGTGDFDAAQVRLGLLLSKAMMLLGLGSRPAKIVDTLAFSANNKPFKPAATPFDWLSRDEKQVDAYIKDPLCGFVFTASGYHDMFTGLMRLTRPESLKAVEPGLSVLFLSGGCDPVGKNGKGVRRAADAFLAAGIRDVTVKLYPGARHEVFNELNREEVYGGLAAWLSASICH